MRLLVTVVSPATRRSTDVVLDADPATPITAVAAELDRFARGDVAGGDVEGDVAGGDVGRGDAGLRRGAGPSAAVPLYVDCQRIWRRLTLAESPIRDGSVISLGSPDGCVVPPPSGLVDILVAGGPDAGVIHRIGPGRADIGGGADNGGADIGGGAAAAIRIGDPAIPERALLVHVNDLGDCHVAAYPGAAAALGRKQLGAPAPWLPGQQIAIGGTLLGLARCAPADAGLRPSPDGGGMDFSRSARTLPAPLPLFLAAPLAARPGGGFAGVAGPTGPDRPTGPNGQAGPMAGQAGPMAADRRSLPVLAAGLPLAIGLALAFLLHQVWLLALAGLSPVLLIGGALSERSGVRRRTAGQPADDADRRTQAERDAHAGLDARAALDAELTARREQCPDPATALGIASGPGRRLWERRRSDPDYLLLRVGTADLPVTVELAGSGRERSGRRRTVVRSVPDALVTVPLAECGVLGVAGPADSARAVGRWLVASAAILHSPHDLRIYLLTDPSGRVGWEWVRWLPHCRPGPGGHCVVQLGNDDESVAARIAELLAIVAARRKTISDGHSGVGFGAGIVVVLDGSRRLRSLPAIGQLLREGPQVGVYAICLDGSERLLPAECQAVAVFGRDGLRVEQTMADTVGGVRADHADPGWCARVARSLAPIRDVSDDGRRRPAFAAGAQRPTAPTPPTPLTEVWVASVEWSALGRPEPVPSAARRRGRGGTLAGAGMIMV
jgi:S-DNA-T family DNA segregation ATPase FtsK/SpoIIIE